MGNSKIPTILILLFFINLCSCRPQEIVNELPTIAVLPTLTSSNTPTNTPTETATRTLTPTATSTITPTPSNTFTLTPILTPTITTTPSFTATPTKTMTSTPVPTDTPTQTNTPDMPQILSFVADATNVVANSTITLSWNTIADTVRIDLLNWQGVGVLSYPVVPVGSLSVTVPANLGKTVIFKLIAIRGGQETSFSIPIIIQCAIAWFFGNEFVSPNSGCPTGYEISGPGSFQQFERGFLLYINANNLNMIYGGQNQGARYITYSNGWDGITMYTCFGTPPSGLFSPQNIFAWVYCTTNAPIGGWSNAIGWGINNTDYTNRTIQFEDTGAFYIDSPIGVIRFTGSSGSTWQMVK